MLGYVILFDSDVFDFLRAIFHGRRLTPVQLAAPGCIDV